MTETELRHFIDTVFNYFQQLTGQGPQMGLPYIKNQDSVVMDFTGLIGISGPRKGGIYLTTKRDLLVKMTQIVLGDSSGDDQVLLDMVGEMANTIAGNLQKYFGADFQISVPIVVSGKPTDVSLRLKPPSFVIPFSWEGMKACLVAGLES